MWKWWIDWQNKHTKPIYHLKQTTDNHDAVQMEKMTYNLIFLPSFPWTSRSVIKPFNEENLETENHHRLYSGGVTARKMWLLTSGRRASPWATTDGWGDSSQWLLWKEVLLPLHCAGFLMSACSPWLCEHGVYLLPQGSQSAFTYREVLPCHGGPGWHWTGHLRSDLKKKSEKEYILPRTPVLLHDIMIFPVASKLRDQVRFYFFFGCCLRIIGGSLSAAAGQHFLRSRTWCLLKKQKCLFWKICYSPKLRCLKPCRDAKWLSCDHLQ